MSDFTRRELLRYSSLAAASVGLASLTEPGSAAEKEPPFKISLAQWSLHKTLFGGKLDNLDFAKTAKHEYGIEAVEYVNQFFKDKSKDQKYLADLKARASDNGVRSVLIMIDGEGDLGDPNAAARSKTVENHYPWVEAAKFLGCHSIRVNAGSKGTYEEQQKLATDGLRKLAEFGKTMDIGVIVENHGGYSSNGEWLAGVIKAVNLPNCGTLPDFGNFGDYDRYKGVTELMPYAKGVSAKTHDFNDEGEETKTNYLKMLKIVKDAGYKGYLGIEYEGSKLSELEGIRATQKLLEKVFKQLG